MKKTVLTFGLLAGAILSAMMLLTMPFMDRIGFDRAEVIGYTTMVAAFLLTFFGIRSYRDEVAGGTIGFGRAFAVGLLITMVASACYVATWQVVYYWLAPDFFQQYAAYAAEKARAGGATAEEVARQAGEIARYAEMYRNPLVNVAFTFLEPLPVGIVTSLVSAGILRRREPAGEAGLSVGPATQAV